MKQVFLSKQGRVISDVPVPVVGEREVLVRVSSSVISTGTETSSDRNKKSGFAEKKELLDKVLKMLSEKGVSKTFDRVMSQLNSNEKNIILSPIGYSNAGVVVAKGRYVDNINVGDKVACCGAGIASHAQFVTCPINMVARIPDGVDFTSAAFSTIGSIAMQGLRRSNVSFGETIVITGLGLLGLLAVQIAKSWGLVVIGVDLNEERMGLAKKFGADECFNAADPKLIDRVSCFTGGVGADAVVIYAATKSSGPVNQAFDICRRKGTVVAVGAVGMELERQKMYEKELNFLISTSYGPGRYDNNYEIEGHDYPIGYVRWTENRNIQEFLRLISVGSVDVTPLISGKFDVVDAILAYSSLIENKNNIASVIDYPEAEEENADNIVFVNEHKIISHSKVRVGVIGAGGFVKARHLKNIMSMSDKFEIVAICNHTPGSAKAEGENYGAKYVTTDYSKLLSDPEIDLIIIGTRHNLHGDLVEKCILADKNVLVEKPLAMTTEEMNRIEKTLASHNVRVYVGFNRRYSPFIQQIKGALSKDNKPIVVNYRINAGAIDKSSWVQSLEIGGGRLIGEGCHFIDLISYICGEDVQSADIVNLPLSKDIQAEDNFIINLKYSNGNIGVLTYTSVGGDSMPKEQMEVFSDGISYVIEDFVKMKIFDKKESKEILLKEQDKGHRRLIEEIQKDLQGEDNIIAPFDLDFMSSGLSIHLVDVIRGIK